MSNHTPKDTRDLLISARKMIERPTRWSKRAFATDSNGHVTLLHSCAACAWCSLGALAAAADPGVDLQPAVEALAKALPAEFFNVAMFNDDPSTAHADVLAMYDRAIEACR